MKWKGSRNEREYSTNNTVGFRADLVDPDSLTVARDPDWLVHFSLGALYDRLDFAAPKEPKQG